MTAHVASSSADLLAQAPFARLLLRSFDERLSGTIEVEATDGSERATIVVLRGRVTKLRTSFPMAFLGTVAYGALLGAVAGFVPALRAARPDPAVALREL